MFLSYASADPVKEHCRSGLGVQTAMRPIAEADKIKLGLDTLVCSLNQL
jgi:hypothetical protein